MDEAAGLQRAADRAFEVSRQVVDAGDVQANGFQIVEDHAPFETFTETGASYMGFAVSALLASGIADKGRYGVAFTGGLAPQMHDQTYDHRAPTWQTNFTRGLDNAGYNKMMTEEEARGRYDMLKSYLGEPVKRGDGLGAFTFAKDLETLPEAFFTGHLGNLPTLSQIVITQLTESDNVWTKVLLPLVAREGSTEWFQSFIIFFGLTALGFVCVVAWAFWRHG